LSSLNCDKDKNVNKTFTYIQLGILFLICSCTAPQVISNISSNDFTFDVTFVNNTNFDLEIIDGSRIIPRHEEKKIILPVYFGELNNGYRVNYRVQLLDQIFVRIPRKENIIINQDQNTVIIETADFQSDLCFLVFQNEGTQTVSLKMDNAYLAPLIQWEPRQYGSTPYLGPGITYAYEIKRGINNLILETDQYKNMSLNFAEARPGHIYRFLFNGENTVALIDERPLTEVGALTPVSVEFTGDNLSGAEKSQIINALISSFENSNVPLRIILPGEEASMEGRIFHSLQINLNTQILPPQPPVNRQIIRADLSLTVLRSGKVMRALNIRNISEMFRSSLLNVLANRLMEETEFFLEIKNDISF